MQNQALIKKLENEVACMSAEMETAYAEYKLLSVLAWEDIKFFRNKIESIHLELDIIAEKCDDSYQKLKKERTVKRCTITRLKKQKSV